LVLYSGHFRTHWVLEEDWFSSLEFCCNSSNVPKFVWHWQMQLKSACQQAPLWGNASGGVRFATFWA
jgi:hypothetical protein